MPRQVVEHDSIAYTIALDDPVAAADRLQAVVMMRLVDELTAQPPRRPAQISSSVRGLSPRAAADGLAGLIGIPQDVFPSLDINTFRIELRIDAEGFVTEQREEEIAAQPTFPIDFDPLDLSDIDLHAEPVLIRGTVIEDDGATRTPVPLAPVSVTDVWRSLPPVGGGGAEAPNMIALTPGLYAGRSTASGQCRARGLTPGGGGKRLTASVFAGETAIPLANQAGLAPGNLLAIEYLDGTLPAHDPARVEYIEIDSIDGGAAVQHQAVIQLRHALAHTHRAGVFARLVTPQAPGPSIPLSRRALASERCIFLTNLAGLAGATTVEVFGGLDLDGNPIPTEYHHVESFDTTTDADGRFELPPLSRVAQIRLETTVGPATPFRLFNPDYARSTNRCDIVHSP